MKKGMCITYEVDGNLYINITNRCTNNCDFCIRNNGDGAYGSDSLWLEREPTVEEILAAVFERDLDKYGEIVFCGYGEPTERLDDARACALKIKERTKTPIRINTNGHASLIKGYDAAPLFKDAFDTVSISLNTPSCEKYLKICHPVFKKDGFYGMLDFARNVNKYVQNTVLSVVREALTQEELLECEKIAAKVGVPLRVRTYIGKEDA